MKYDIFLSYSRRDGGEFAEVLAQHLTKSGFRIFIDNELLKAGDLEANHRASLQKADSVVLLLTADAAASPWVRNEIALALREKRSLIPVLLDKEAKEGPLMSLVGDRLFLTGDRNRPGDVAKQIAYSLSAQLAPRRRLRLLETTVAAFCLLICITIILAIWGVKGNRREMTGQALVRLWRQTGHAADAKVQNRTFVDLDLSRLDLRSIQMSNCVFLSCNLSQTILAHATLTNCYIARAFAAKVDASQSRLSLLRIVDSMFQDSDFRGASLRFASLRYVDFQRSDFRGADLRGADLTGTDFTAAQMQDALYDGETRFPSPPFDPKARGMVLQAGNPK